MVSMVSMGSPQVTKRTSIYWFRNDLRLTDNPALLEACAAAERLSLVYLMPPAATQPTAWGFPRWGPHRLTVREQARQGLEAEVAKRGGRLHSVVGTAAQTLVAHAHAIGADQVFCEAIAAPEELAEVASLRDAGLQVCERWQSSLLEPAALPFAVADLPAVFTAFRLAVERAALIPRAPCLAPAGFPPDGGGTSHAPWVAEAAVVPADAAAFPFHDPAYHGSEIAGLAHLERYFGSTAPQTYKTTRNGLIGTSFSTKLSPWLANGALSPRTVFQSLKAHEALRGANDSTYWIGFELLWRDFFRLWSMKHGARLFRARGLGAEPPAHDPLAFARWCAGTTGQAFIDAGMRELAATGYLSNRMRQVVASYLVHDLGCDWRAGAAWFESRLIDFDVCSNQGNWLYAAGRGADPRPRRWFDPDKQASQHDADGAYRRLWRDA
jgi:deoxyribodipyrimidine photo-lyase